MDNETYDVALDEVSTSARAAELGDGEIDLSDITEVEDQTPVLESQAGHSAVVIARGEMGVRESGGQNRGVPHERYVRYFGANLPPLPWCAFFVSWAFAGAGRRPPWRNPGYVGSINDWARDNNRLVRTPQHGDIFGLADDHTGLVAGANPQAGQIYSIEGNWGDRVASRLVNYRAVGLWFARF